MADNVVKTFTVKINTETGKIAVDGLTKKFVQAETAFKKLNAEAANLTKNAINPLAGATGLAGAAVTELGRTVSDLNYGFPAVANNISQLGSLFTILIAKANGARGALALILKEMRGPLGFLFAFQIGVTLIESISKGFIKLGKDSSTLNKAFKEVGKEVSKTSGKFESYISILQNSNKTQEEHEKAINALNKEFPEFIKKLDEANVSMDDIKNSTEEATKQIDLQRTAIINLAKSRGAQKRIEELSIEIIDKEIERRNELIALGIEESELDLAKRKADRTSIGEFTEVSETRRIAAINRLIASREEHKEFIDSKNKEIKLLSEYVDIDDIFTDKTKKSSQRRIKIFKEQLLTFEREEESYRKQSEKAEAIYEEDKIEIRRQAALRDLELKYEDFKLDQSLRLQQFLFQLDLDKKSELAKAKTEEEKRKIEERYHNAGVDAVVKYNESLIQANSNYLNAIDEANKSFNTQTEAFFQQQALKDLQGFIQQMQIGNDLAKQFQIDMATNEMDRLQAQDELRGQQFEREKGILERQIEVDQERGLATEELEQKLANLKERNRQEDVKSTEKAEKIKLSIANQVGNAIIGIAGKGSAIGKAVAVAMAIMNTKEAITNALGAKPYGPWNIAQAVAVGAFGFKQVKDILSTKLPVGAGSAGAGAAPTTVEAPDFNVVGAGTGSQLAQAVGASQSRPFRAYVVSGDVTSAQEFDRKTVNQSALG